MSSKCPWWGRNSRIILIGICLLAIAWPAMWKQWGEPEAVQANSLVKNSAVFSQKCLDNLVIVEGNSILAISSPSNPKPERIRKMQVTVTGYSSTPWETDDTPYITAAGTKVRPGIVANNYLPLGTNIRIPKLFGNKIFVVEDRMSWKKSNYHIDVWFPNYWQALNFGTKRTYIEILES